MEIYMGCTSKTITEQLDAQGIVYALKVGEKFNKYHKMLCELKFCKLFTPSQINTAYDKLFKQIEKHVKEQQE